MHTPGPWSTFTDTEDCTVVHIGAPLLPYVATAFGDDPHSITPQQMANAVLLSAAPDLLAALQALLPHVPVPRVPMGDDPSNPFPLPDYIAQARAALNKALGE